MFPPWAIELSMYFFHCDCFVLIGLNFCVGFSVVRIFSNFPCNKTHIIWNKLCKSFKIDGDFAVEVRFMVDGHVSIMARVIVYICYVVVLMF